MIFTQVIDYKEILPEHIVQSFRNEFRAQKEAEELTKKEAEEAQYLASRSEFAAASDAAEAQSEEMALPLGELTNREVNPLGSASRPLTGHSEISMDKMSASAHPPVPTAWAKKGKKHIPRAQQSSVGSCLTWD